MNKQKFGVRIWLWIVLAVVIVISLGWIGYQKIAGNKTTTALTSPTPIKSATISPKATGTTSSPTAEKTATPTSTTTTPTPQPSPPAGWKLDTQSLSIGRGENAGGKYSVFIKNNWTAVPMGDVIWPNAGIAYSDNSNCVASNYGMGTDVYDNYCLFKVGTGQTNLVISFNDSNISPADKQIVLDSFKVDRFSNQ